MREKNGQLMKIAQAGLMAALCYIGYAVFPAISASGTKIHIGNAFVVLSAYLLGGVYGGLPVLLAYPLLISLAAMRHLHRELLSQSL